MISTRTLGLGLGPSLRQATFASNVTVARINVFRNTLKTSFTKRTVQTQSFKPEEQTNILNAQRLKRPSSPHFTIYQPQLTWLSSIANRVTGVGLSVLLYGFSLAYLVAPGTFDSTHVVEFVAGLPEAVKYAGKFILAAPFTFHSFNGLRHLAWDSGRFLTLKGSYTAGYAVLGASAIGTVVLMFQ